MTDEEEKRKKREKEEEEQKDLFNIGMKTDFGPSINLTTGEVEILPSAEFGIRIDL